VSATTRSLLKLDQAYIAVGGRDHLTLIGELDTLLDTLRFARLPFV
jgi:hypothetical protein